VQPFPDAICTFRDVGLGGAAVVHLEVLVSTVAKELRAARPEVGEPGDVLLWRQAGRPVEWIVDMSTPCEPRLRTPQNLLQSGGGPYIIATNRICGLMSRMNRVIIAGLLVLSTVIARAHCVSVQCD